MISVCELLWAITNLDSKEYEDSDGCSYGESDTSNWEYHPKHVDGEVGLVVDEVLGMQENTSNSHWKITSKVTVHYKLLDYWRNTRHIRLQRSYLCRIQD